MVLLALVYGAAKVPRVKHRVEYYQTLSSPLLFAGVFAGV